MKLEDTGKDGTLTLSEPRLTTQSLVHELITFGHMLYSLDKNAFLNVFVRLLKVRSRSGPCYVFWAGVWSTPTCWQQLQTLGETSCQHTGSRSGYLVLTDGQQTHQVPVKVHQEAALEMHSHTDNPYNKWTLKRLWAWTFTSAVFLYKTYVTKKQENDIWYIICSLLGNRCYNGDFFFIENKCVLITIYCQ